MSKKCIHKKAGKLPIILLVVALAFSLFGCSSQNPRETVPAETTSPVVTTEATTEATTQPTTEPTETTVPVETTVATEPVETTVPTEAPTEPQGIPGTVTARSLNVRSEPGVGNPLVTSLPYGTSVTVYEKTRKDGADWGRIDQGWVSLEYVKLESGGASVPTTQPNKPTQPTTPADQNTDPQHKHTYTESVTKPTCSAQGYTTYTCSCGESYMGNQKAALGHSWSAWKTVTQPTQTANGKEERKCTRCNATESRTLDKLGQTGHTHKYNTGTVTTKPGCEVSGVKTFSCSCGASYTETIPAAGHSYSSKTVAATCDVGGYTKHTCKSCGSSYTDSHTAPLDHSYGAWTTTTQPTETSTGVSTRTCTHCGRTETKTIPKLEPKPTEPTPKPTESKPTEPKPTEPAPTEPKPTEPPVTEPPVTEHVHEWVHHHQDEVGHEVVYCTCHCGWSCAAEDDAAWIAHEYSFVNDPEEFNKHSYYSTSKWVVDQPAKDWYECACGVTKQD